MWASVNHGMAAIGWSCAHAVEMSAAHMVTVKNVTSLITHLKRITPLAE
jgi:hypothetical protein